MAGEPSFAADIAISSLHQLPAVTSSMSLSASTTSALLRAVPIFQEASSPDSSSNPSAPGSGVGDRLAVRWPSGVACSRLCVGMRGNRMEGSSTVGGPVVLEEEGGEEAGGEGGLRKAQAEMRRMQLSWLDEQVSQRCMCVLT